MPVRTGSFCCNHITNRSQQWLTGSRDCQVQHDNCTCRDYPRWITKGCEQHAPYRESTD